ncbi:MAG: tRNA pseudouridine(55) synthase TruB [Deltaproteobacteria bacterium]|nr:tRNA pseudouridine(55) synthase TruB [Deltaproteobacteria bacterium]
MRHGVLLTCKPDACTSFDVVKRLRRRLRPLKVGHTGTLDPMATGLLPLAIGEATKLTRFLQQDPKRYRARIRLGLATDTLDRQGRETARCPVPPFDLARLEEICARFRGPIEQVPPMYSALHFQGHRLHELARSGIEVERAPRRVHIHELAILDHGPDFIELDIFCSAGTYVRSLAIDIAGALGTAGHLESLCRTAASGWKLQAAHGLSELESLDPPALEERIIPLLEVLERFERIDVDEDLGRRLASGQHPDWTLLTRLGVQADSERLVWFHPPASRPLVLARLLPGDDPAIEILRVLHPLRQPA